MKDLLNETRPGGVERPRSVREAGSRALAGPLSFLILAILTPARASEPVVMQEVVRVRTPADKAPGVFPSGTDLRVLPIDEFESLLRKARDRVTESRGQRQASLLRATYTGRLDEELLRGRAELTMRNPASDHASLTIEPWSAAIVGHLSGPPVISSGDGTQQTWLPPSEEVTSRFEWTQASVRGTGGRLFRMAFPTTPISSLLLDLPDDTIPEVEAPQVARPDGSSRSGRSTWRIEGLAGEVTLRIRDRDDEQGSHPRDPAFWVQDRTRVEVIDGVGRWTSDWTLQPGMIRLGQVDVELDEGLELLSVTGPGVVGFRSTGEATAGKSRAVIMMKPSNQEASVLSLRAVCRVPSEGVWSVPSARAAGGVWVEGTTEVIVGPGRSIERVEPRFGRRVRSEPDEPMGRETKRLTFESIRPDSVANIVFGRPAADVVADVRGLLRIGPLSRRFEARVSWRVVRGRAIELSCQIPPGWITTRVQISGLEEPTRWRSDRNPDGSTRLVVVPPSYLDFSLPLAVDLAGEWTEPWGDALPAPRIRTVDGRTIDEMWLVLADPGGAVRPIEPKGLVWLDPSALSPPATLPEDWRHSQQALAYRWIEPDGSVSFDFSDTQYPPRGECWVLKSPEKRAIDWYLRLDFGQDLAFPLELRTHGAIESAPVWEAITRDPTDSAIAMIPAESSRLDADGRWTLALSHALGTGPILLHATIEPPSDDPDLIPFFTLDPASQCVGTVLILQGNETRPEVEARDLSRIDPDLAARNYLETLEGFGSTIDGQVEPISPDGVAVALAYGAKPGLLRSHEIAMEPVADGGIILEAIGRGEVTRGTDKDARRMRLFLTPGPDRKLRVSLPPDASLDWLSVDGRTIAPISMGQWFEVPLPAPRSATRIVEVEFAYHHSFAEILGATQDSERWPVFSMPCLAATWELWGTAADPSKAPEPWKSVALPTSSPVGLLSGRIFEGFLDDAPRLPGVRLMAETMDKLEDPGQTLGDFLLRLDGVGGPIVVDRLAFLSAGIGPETRTTPAFGAKGAAEQVDRLLSELALEPRLLDGTLLLTTTASESLTAIDREAEGGSPGEQPMHRAIREAAMRGRDATDRFQAVDRWRSSPTPIDPRDRNLGLVDTPGSIRRWTRMGSATWAPMPGQREGSSPYWPLALSIVLTSLVGLGIGQLRARRLGLYAFGLASTAGLLLAWLAPGVSSVIGRGIVAGCLIAVAWQVGLAPRTPARTGSSRGFSGLAARLLGCGLILIGTSWPSELGALAQSQAEEPAPPIVAVLPYDEPGDEPRRVLMRLDDFRRLESLGAEPLEDRSREIAARSAEHHLKPIGPGRWRFVSTYELETRGDGPVGCVLPTAGLAAIAARLDGSDAPVRMNGGSRQAEVQIPEAGHHRLSICGDYSVEDSPTGTFEFIPVANSTLRIGSLPDSPPADLAGQIAGGLRIEGAEVLAELGPVRSVRLATATDQAPPRSAIQAEAMVLWDLKPAGDLFSLRLTVPANGRDSRLRLELEPGILVRDCSVANWRDATWEGTPARPIWVLNRPIDLNPAGSPIVVELWRPRPEMDPGPFEIRRGPRIRPLDVGSYSGLAGIRSRDDWAVHAPERPSNTPGRREDFVRIWGAQLPGSDDFLGFVSWPDIDRVVARFAPRPDRADVDSVVQLELGPGRVEVRIDASIEDRSSYIDQVVATLPPELNLVQVDSEGLTDWTLEADHRLRLRYDARPSPRRRVNLRGWVAGQVIGTDGQGSRQIGLPIPIWAGAGSIDTTLEISAPPTLPFRVDDRLGFVETSAPHPDETGAIRASYVATDDRASASILWAVEAPVADVHVRSILAIQSDAVQWIARVRYSYSGGPGQELRFQMPVAWSRELRVSPLEGTLDVQVEETGPLAVVTLRPDPPIWGAREFLVLSTAPLTSRRIEFPDLVPLGNGRVETFIGWVDRSGRSASVERSSGIQSIDAARVGSIGMPMRLAADADVYRVQRTGWQLALTLAGMQSDESPVAAGRTVQFADYDCVVGEDGTVLGLGRFFILPGRERSLSLRVDPRIRILATSAVPERVVRRDSVSGLVVIPVTSEGPERVELIWSREGGANDLGTIPAPTQPGVPVLIRAFAPIGLDVRHRGAEDWKTTPEVLAVERVRSLERYLLRSISADSGIETRKLMPGLIEFLLRSRAAVRGLQQALAGPGPASRSFDRASLSREVAESGERLESFLSQGGLGGSMKLARELVTSGSTEGPVTPARGLSSSLRIPLVGGEFAFVGATEEDGSLPSLVRAPEADASRTSTLRGDGPPFLIAALLMPVAWFWTRLRSRRIRAVVFALGAAVLSIASGAGLPTLVGASSLYLLARGLRHARVA